VDDEPLCVLPEERDEEEPDDLPVFLDEPDDEPDD
jgi:hypothetical protein